MILDNRRGLLSMRALLLLFALFVVGALVVGPLRSWVSGLLDANAARQAELERRIQAKRFAGMKSHLENAGIDIEGVTTSSPPDTVAYPPPKTEQSQPGFFARWWRRARGVAEPGPSRLFPAPADSLGLRPGERMFLPDGRVLQYDSTAIRRNPRP